MLLINRISTDPYFNIAAEEYVFRNIEEDTVMLWRSKPSLIIGKHQNPIQEINLTYAHKYNIPIIRRISGGGTVFHDLGNLNFSFTAKGKEGKLIDFKKYLQPIIQALATIGVKAEITGKNNLSISGKKISGNAAHVYKNKSLHHGTLLFSTEMSALKESLKTTQAVLESNAVASIPAKTTNIQQHLPQQYASWDIIAFQEALKNAMESYFSNIIHYEFTDRDVAEINALVKKRYQTWEWNIGYAPKYTFRKQLKLLDDVLDVYLKVDKGIVEQIGLSSSNHAYNTKYLEDKIVKTPHTYPHIIAVLETENCLPLIDLFF